MGKLSNSRVYNWPDGGEAANDIASPGKQPGKALRRRLEDNIPLGHTPPVTTKHPDNVGEAYKDIATSGERTDKYAAAYMQGFAAKCAEFDIDPAAMLEQLLAPA